MANRFFLNPVDRAANELRDAPRQIELTNRLGLHLRAADQFVRLARRFQCEIRVRHHGDQCDGKSILDLMILAAEFGASLELETCGPDACEAVEALAVLVSTRFREDESGDTTDEPSGAEPAS